MSDGAEDEEACPPGRLNRARSLQPCFVHEPHHDDLCMLAHDQAIR